VKALISVSDKTGLIDLAHNLEKLNIEIVATKGTAQQLVEQNIKVTAIETITKFPEIMDGRVKTLHPTIMGGVLGKRNQHQSEANLHQIPWFDLVICNLYPFATVIKNKATSFEKIVENIDIGGQTMIRAAAKNHAWTTVVIDPNDYQLILEELRTTKTISLITRKKLAAKAFAYTAQYDSIIANHLQTEFFPQHLTIPLEKVSSLRYGENPHQLASVYQYSNNSDGLLNAVQHQGKQLSFNNLLDADNALKCISTFTPSICACAIVKHANPCGVAVANNIDIAFMSAWLADAKSSFGSVVALNTKCTEVIAEDLKPVFIEVLIAPGYDRAALKILKNKPNLRVLEIADFTAITKQKYAFKPLADGILVQSFNHHLLCNNDLNCVTKKHPAAETIKKLLFAWHVAKHAKSNAIVIAGTNADEACVTLGIGQGQVARIDAVEIALRKSGHELRGAVLASDGFFPFRDSIDYIANTGIEAIIQPGGSIRDDEVIATCDEFGIAMVFTNIRNFNH